MEYILMHRNLPVLHMELDEETGSVQKVLTILQPEHLPLGTLRRQGDVDRAALNKWWSDRSIPASRSGIYHALEALDIPSTKLLLTRCYGLSLSDQYWVKPAGSDLQWSRINFFENPFSEDIGDVLLGKATDYIGFDFCSPDNTSDGYLKKRWKIIDGKRCLLKAGSEPFMQQPFNEVIASKLAKRLGISHVSYHLVWDDGIPYSVCEDFITPDTELVSAWRIMQAKKKDNATSVYRHYLNCCEAFGIQNMARILDQMIVLDYLLANEDRHQNNFGLIRRADTLEYLGAAPLFDSGSSLGYNKLPNQIRSILRVECKPFKKTHAEQLKLVTSFDWLRLSAIDGFEAEMRDVFDQAGDYMDETRKDAIISAFSNRVRMLMEFTQHQKPEDDVTRDVTQDTAQDYTMKIDF